MLRNIELEKKLILMLIYDTIPDEVFVTHTFSLLHFLQIRSLLECEVKKDRRRIIPTK